MVWNGRKYQQAASLIEHWYSKYVNKSYSSIQKVHLKIVYIQQACERHVHATNHYGIVIKATLHITSHLLDWLLFIKDHTSVGEDMDTLEPLYTFGIGIKMMQLLLKMIWCMSVSSLFNTVTKYLRKQIKGRKIFLALRFSF
jgi:hypothetical protein